MKKNNKLIAEFMDLKPCDNQQEYDSCKYTNVTADLKYNESWDWLMPVVGKIYELSGFFSVNGINGELALAMRDGLAEADMDEVYQAVVNFIESHNKKGESK